MSKEEQELEEAIQRIKDLIRKKEFSELMLTSKEKKIQDQMNKKIQKEIDKEIEKFKENKD